MSFRDVGVRLVSECGAQLRKHRHFATILQHHVRRPRRPCMVNPTHSTMTELKEARRTSLTRRIREDSSFSEQAEIVKVEHTIPQERIPKRFLEQIRRSTSGRSRSSRILLAGKQVVNTVEGEDAPNPQEDVASERRSIQTTINLTKINQTNQTDRDSSDSVIRSRRPPVFRKSHSKS